MKRPIKWKYLLGAAGLVLLVLMIMDLNQRLETMNSLNAQVRIVRAETTRVVQTHEALLGQVAYADSDAAVEEWAYEDGHWVKSGETLIQIIPGPGATPTVEPEVTKGPVAGIQNWQVWWELFFGN
jgi:cell division protein FtsB